jgi:hypothetical protein
MNRIPMSPAAGALLRALIARARAPRDRILLSDVSSVEWHSLTFTGERHLLHLRICGSDSLAVQHRMCSGLDDAESSIPGLTVADIAVAGAPGREPDGSISLTIEALTLAED